MTTEISTRKIMSQRQIGGSDLIPTKDGMVTWVPD